MEVQGSRTQPERVLAALAHSSILFRLLPLNFVGGAYIGLGIGIAVALSIWFAMKGKSGYVKGQALQAVVYQVAVVVVTMVWGYAWVLLAAGIFIIYKIATHKRFTRRWERFIENKLIKSPVIEEASIEDQLHFLEGYGVVKKIIGPSSPLIGSSLADWKLNEKGVLVLGNERKRNWVPIPKATEIILEDDRLVVYGPHKKLKELLKTPTTLAGKPGDLNKR